MKRITTLLLAVAFALGSVCAAQADGIDIKVKGQWDFAFGVVNNRVFKESVNWSNPRGTRQMGQSGQGTRRDNDNFEARQRIRTQINFISSEYLQAVLMFEIGDLDWGRGGSSGRSSGGALDADGVNIETKRAYLDWIIPNTEISVRMGIQDMSVPSTRFDSVIMDADVAGITVSAPITDWLSLTAFWARPFDRFRNDRENDTDNDHLDDETDLFGIVAPITFNGVAISPYFIWGNAGTASGAAAYALGANSGLGTITSSIENSSAKIWFLGSNFKLNMFDPLVFDMDVIYGKMQKAEYGTPSNHGELGTEGWYIAATLDYKFSWGTPGVFGWWASGDDYDDVQNGELGRIPAFMNDGNTFDATSFGTTGFYAIGNGGNANVVSGSGAGTWGVGIQVADVSFIQDLSHTLRFAYYRGTNDPDVVKEGEIAPGWACDGLYLTKDDSVFEVNFDHTYKIYENLTAVLELGYLRLNSDKDTWAPGGNTDFKDNDDAWKAEINFRYAF